MGESPNRSSGNRALAIVAIGAAVAIIVISLVQGRPRALPGVALGWPLILYLERAGFAALLITGVGGVLYRLLTGGQVKGTGGGPAPGVDVEDATQPTEVLKEGVDEDVKDLNDRLFSVEKGLDELQQRGSTPEREE